MKSKALLTVLAGSLLSSGALFADNVVTRIDHPNGPATYITTPDRGRDFAAERRSGPTIGVYAGQRSFGRGLEAVRTETGLTDSSGRTLVPFHHGRGQVDYIAVER
jgi:hypothetical protein